MNKEFFKRRYSGAPTVAFGFHGCTKETADRVLNFGEELKDSTNDYDWLGKGKYFWEANPQRALLWAEERYKSAKPAVIGACIDLSQCLNMIDSEGLDKLKRAYEFAKQLAIMDNRKMPENQSGKNFDLLLRRLDCHVVEAACGLQEETKDLLPYTTVRGVFWEGEDLYPNAGFKEKNHIQICVRDTKAILCYFHPRCFGIHPTDSIIAKLCSPFMFT